MPTEIILAKDAIKLTDVDPNKPMVPIIKTTRVTRDNRMEVREVLPEGIPNKTHRIALPLNRVVEYSCSNLFWPIPRASQIFIIDVGPLATTSMQPDDRNTTFYIVHILAAVRLMRIGSRELIFVAVSQEILEMVYKKVLTPTASFMAFSWDHPTVPQFSSSPD